MIYSHFTTLSNDRIENCLKLLHKFLFITKMCILRDIDNLCEKSYTYFNNNTYMLKETSFFNSLLRNE